MPMKKTNILLIVFCLLLAGCAYPQTNGRENNVLADNKSAVAAENHDTADIVQTEDAQKIITQYSCTGTVVFTKSGANTEKAIEYVTTDEVVGKFYMDDAFHETKRAAIYYAKKGSHVVPVKEEQNG
jgi:hypothetical protein